MERRGEGVRALHRRLPSELVETGRGNGDGDVRFVRPRDESCRLNFQRGVRLRCSVLERSNGEPGVHLVRRERRERGGLHRDHGVLVRCRLLGNSPSRWDVHLVRR